MNPKIKSRPGPPPIARFYVGGGRMIGHLDDRSSSMIAHPAETAKTPGGNDYDKCNSPAKNGKSFLSRVAKSARYSEQQCGRCRPGTPSSLKF